MDIYGKIDDLLAEKQMSRRRLAQQLGIAPSTFQSMMTRKRGLTFENAIKIAECLGVSTDVLYYGAEIDRDYENLCEILEKVGLSIEAAGYGEGPDEKGDHYYIWHRDAENQEEDRVELVYRDIMTIVGATQRDAEAHKQQYIRQRLETDIFTPWAKEKPPQP